MRDKLDLAFYSEFNSFVSSPFTFTFYVLSTFSSRLVDAFLTFQTLPDKCTPPYIDTTNKHATHYFFFSFTFTQT